MRSILIVGAVGFLIVPGAGGDQGAGRPPEKSLNGPWEYVKVPELTLPPPQAGWQPITVPQCLFGWNYERAWFRRRFQIPAEWAGMRLKLCFQGAKWNSQVYVNAFHVGGHFGGYEPFTLDITAAARPGATNELLVGLHDWTGVFQGTPDLGPEGSVDELRSRPRDAVLAPIGGHITAYGLWDDVTLQAVPPIYIDDVWVQTSVRRSEITVHVTLANESGKSAQVVVSNAVRPWKKGEGKEWSQGKPQGPTGAKGGGASSNPKVVLSFPEQTVTLRPGVRQTLTFRWAWSNAETWSPEHPKLYELWTKLSGGASADEACTRFGFREFWIEGPDFVLNGAKIHLLAASTWPSVQPQPRSEVEQTLQQIKAAHCVCFRTHTQPWRQVWYEVADEVGLLMIPEGAVWNDDEVYRIEAPAFWENYADHLQRTVNHLKNHPSVIAYSLENEMYGARLNDTSPAKAWLVELGRRMKEWDPTRPITYESDLDPGGVADFIGLHYPHEYPQFNLYPNTCYWMEEPLPTPGGFTNGAPTWKWKRDKPLYIGEFLWVPSSDPSWHTIFFGDEAYTEYSRYRNLAKAWAWRMQIEAYRWYGVSGICPWTMLEGGPRLDEENPLFVACREAFAPIAAFVREYDTRFYANREVPRTVTVYNDVREPSSLILAWKVEAGGKRQAAEQVAMALQPAEKKTLTVTLRTPPVAEPTPWSWTVQVLREGQVQHKQVKSYTVFPAPERWNLPSARIGLYDPIGRTKKVLAQQGVAFQELATLQEALAPPFSPGEEKPYDLLIIGERAFRAGLRKRPVIGQPDPLPEHLEGFIRNGGRALVLAQEVYPPYLFPTDLSDHAATLAFVQRPDHPLLQGIRPEDLRFWRGDHLVSEHNPLRPRAEGCRPIVTAGSAQGLNYAPLLEWPRGRGTLLLCQLKLIEKFANEPIAARLLENALRYLITCQPEAKPVAVVGDAAFQQALRRFHLRFEDVTATLAEADLSRYSLLLVHADVGPLLQTSERIRGFVEQGGKVYLHALTPEAWESLQPLTGVSSLLQPHRGPIVKNPEEPLAQALLQEDLYWLQEKVGWDWWSETPRVSHMAPFAFSKRLEPEKAEVYEAEEMEIEALISGVGEGGVVLATVGTLRQKIDFPEAGTYLFGLRAGGSSVAGVFPTVEVRLDHRLLGTVGLARGEYDLYTVWGDVPAGSHTLSLSFTNDAQVGGEDRNLLVDKLYVARDTAPADQNVAFLTQPPAVAQIRRGRGFYLLDEVSWDTEEINATKAARYVTILLTEAGADFYWPGGVFIEAEDMQPDAGIAWFRREADAVYLGSQGTLRTTVECARTGEYIFEILGYSTPAEGQYGLLAVAIDGRPVGEVELKASTWQGFPLVVLLTQGEHEIAVSFINDLYKPPQDRNVWLDRIQIYSPPSD